MRRCEMLLCECEVEESKVVERDGGFFCSEACARDQADDDGFCGCTHEVCVD